MTAMIEKADRPTGALALSTEQAGWTDQQKAALVQLGLDKAPDADLSVFLHYCQRTGMDPFTRQIYMIGRYDPEAGRKKFTIQMAIDGFRIIAQRSLQYCGQTEPQWCGPDGVWRDVWVDQRRPPVAARIGVYRQGWPAPTYAVAHFDEFAPRKKDGELTAMWQRMPANQIAKCAEAAALRKAFPHDLSGIYAPEELEKADEIPQPVASVAKSKPEPIDWDARITEVNDDEEITDKVAALQALWREARGLDPNNLAAQERIAAAGTAAKEAADKAAAEQVLDAEVVDEPTGAPSEDEITEALSAAQAREQGAQS